MEVSASDDYYAVLGVPRDADAGAIKKAFRRQALRHHPDKGGNEETFKKVCTACEVLSDPEKRQIYDIYGAEGLENGGPANAQHMNMDHAREIFEAFFGRNGGFGGFGGFGSSFFDDEDDFFGRDPFLAGAEQRRNTGPSRGGRSMFGGDDFFKSMMTGIDDGFGAGSGSSFMSSSFSTSFSSGGAGGISRSTKTTTRIENGRRVTVTETTTRHPDGRIERNVETTGGNPRLERGSSSSKKEFIGY